MSPGRNEILRSLSTLSSATFSALVDAIVAGRRRTDILVEGGAREVRAPRIAVPSSPAPRTRMFDAILDSGA